MDHLHCLFKTHFWDMENPLEITLGLISFSVRNAGHFKWNNLVWFEIQTNLKWLFG
jgi:hypothetical protein